MIEKNLGKNQRIIRLLAGGALLAWVLHRQDIDPFATVAFIVGVALILNGIFSRCYLWHSLALDSCRCRGDNDERASG
ncbi:MAG: DUF2892 domain-containing protein [Pseudomonadota bacterium]